MRHNTTTLGAALRSLTLAAALILTASGCATTGSNARTPSGRGAFARNLELVQHSGEHAALTVLIEPRRYPELRASLQLGGLLRSQRLAGIDAALSAPDLWSAVGALVAATSESGKAAPWPATLAGWDDSRPLVIALFDAPPIDLGELAIAYLDAKRPLPGPHSVHHRVLLPARNPAVLARALGDALRAAGLRADAPGAFFGRGLQLRVLLEAGYVRVEAALAEPDAAALYTELQARPRVAAASILTPALQFALRSSDALRVYFRPGVLANLNRARSAQIVLAALAGIDPEMKTVLALKGWSETAGGEAIFNASDAEVVDTALALSGDAGGVRTTSVLSLSESGQALYELGVQRASHFQQAAGPPALGRLRVGLDLAAMADRAAQPWTQTAPDDASNPASFLRKLLDRMHGCGGLCTVYLGVRHPLAVARLLAEQESRVRSSLPHGADLTLLDVQDGKPRGALAVTLPSSLSLKAGLFALRMSMGLRSDWGDTLPDGLQALRLGLGVDPTAVYGTEVSAGPDAASLARGAAQTFLEFELSSAQLPPQLGDLGDLSRWLQTFAGLRIRAQLWPMAGAIVAQSILAPAAAGPPAAPEFGLAAELLPRERGWQRAQAAADRAAESAGITCLNRVVPQLARAADAVAGIDPSMKLVVLKAAEAELRQAEACAERDPRARAMAEHLRTAWSLALASLNTPPQ